MAAWAVAAGSLLLGLSADVARATASEGREREAPRAAYYLEIAWEAYEEAKRSFHRERQGQQTSEWFNSLWDAQNQISAAISWAERNSSVWFQAANLTFQMGSLARLTRPKHHLVTDALDFWAYALRLEVEAVGGDMAAGGGPLSQALRPWLQALAEAPAAPRLWPEVTRETWRQLHARFAGVGTAEALQRLPQRRFRRGSAARSFEAPQGEVCDRAGGDRAASAAGSAEGGRLEVLFPTYVYRKDLMAELGEDFFTKLSSAAVDGYVGYRSRYLDQLQKDGVDVATVPDSRISSGFFQSQAEFREADFQRAEVRARWPELWGSEEFAALLGLARAACLEYLRQAGVQLSRAEVEATSLSIWAAVYPQDLAAQAMHNWHIHPGAWASGVIYAANPLHSPLVFADPRGAPPAGEHDRRWAAGQAFEPRAPFDAVHRIFARGGELVIFPPWLLHQVPPVLDVGGEGTWRVAFAFNLHSGGRGGRSGSAWDSWERTA